MRTKADTQALIQSSLINSQNCRQYKKLFAEKMEKCCKQRSRHAKLNAEYRGRQSFVHQIESIFDP